MRKFLSHIEYLLTEQSHVIVPGFGVFICENKSAEILEDGSIKAPSREIRFNTQIAHNDETLASSIADIESISTDEAHSYVTQMVKELIWTLSIETEVSLGQTGKLIVENDEIIFIESVRGINLFNNFGLKSLSIKPIEIKEEKTETPVISESKEKIHISINKRTLRHVASVAAAIILFFLFSAPVTQQNTHINYAGIVSSEIFKQKQMSLLTDSVSDSAENYSVIEASVGAIPKSISQVEQELTASKENKNKSLATQTETKDKYYIIVNSFPDKRETEHYLNRLHKDGYHSAALLENGNRSRIYIKSFPADQRDNAQDELNTLRKNKKFADAWIYSLKS